MGTDSLDYLGIPAPRKIIGNPCPVPESVPETLRAEARLTRIGCDKQQQWAAGSDKRRQAAAVVRAAARFVYGRFLGPAPETLYAGTYSNDKRWWTDRIGEWEEQGRDVFAYFNNDPCFHALPNAGTLKRILSPP